MTSYRSSIVILIVSLLAASCDSAQTDNPLAPGSEKVILIIGDGMDDQQITIGRNYLAGRQGRLTLDTMPYRGVVRVYSVAESDPNQINYVTDSAGTATAMATGFVTSSARVGTMAKTNEHRTNILELAQSAEIGTGIVTTASVTDATPASFVAHINNRWCQGPESMAGTFMRAPQLAYECNSSVRSNGGLGSIAEQIAYSSVDIVLGGGRKHFEELIDGDANTDVLQLAQSTGFMITDDLSSVATYPPESRVLGLFSADTMPVMLRGVNDAKAQRLTKSGGALQMPEAFSCEANPEFSGMPTLPEMTSTALKHLDDQEKFILIIESASIDKQSHARRPCGHIGELGQLDATLKTALEYAKLHPETLILVTADHGQVAHIISETSMFAARGFGSPGYFARVRTPEGGIMGVNYASTDMPIIEGHSGAQVPLYASGPGSERFPSFIDQTSIFELAAQHLGLVVPGPQDLSPTNALTGAD
jgi:alkaline phosphatase